MSRIIVLMVFGMLSHIVRKLGPSIVLFVFVWAMHSKTIANLGDTVFGLPSHGVLAAAAIILGVLTMALRDSVRALALRAHKRASPLLIRWILQDINAYDLSINNLHRLCTDISNGLQGTAVILLLIAIAVFAFPLFALVLAVVTVIVAGLSIVAAREPVSTGPQGFFRRLKAHPDYYAEALVVAGLIIAFLAVANEQSMVSGTVFIYFVSRFTNVFKLMAKTILVINRARTTNSRNWKLDAKRRAKAKAKKRAKAGQKPKKPALVADRPAA